jgi:hypothetical protein
MSMSNLIQINISIMDMKKMLICLFIFMLMGMEKEWGNNKSGGR